MGRKPRLGERDGSLSINPPQGPLAAAPSGSTAPSRPLCTLHSLELMLRALPEACPPGQASTSLANVRGQRPPGPGLSEEQRALSELPPNSHLRSELGFPQLPCAPRRRNHWEKLPDHWPCVSTPNPSRARPPWEFHSHAQQGEAMFAPSRSGRNVLQRYLGLLPSRFPGCFPGKSGRRISPSSSSPGGARSTERELEEPGHTAPDSEA